MTHKYTTVRLLESTYKLLKIEAAIRGLSLSELLDLAVKRETAKTGKMLTNAAGRHTAEKRHKA